MKMFKKIVLLLIGVGIISFLCFFSFRSTKEPFDETTFKNLIMKTMYQRAEADFVPDIIIDDFPASAWLFAKKYEYKATEVLLGWDSVLEIAEGKGEGTMTIYLGEELYQLPFPSVLISRTHYSFYTICPMEVSLFYNEKKSLTEWVGIFKDIPIMASSVDGKELWGAKDNIRIKYTLNGEDVSGIEVTFYSQHRSKFKAIKKEMMNALYSMTPIRAGDWLLRSQWNVPNEWVDSRIDFEEISRIYLKDFSWSLSVPLLKGEIVLWNGYFIEGVLYFTYDNWRQAEDIANWFQDIQFSVSRSGDVIEVKISDELMKDVFSYLGLLNSDNYDKLRKTFLEGMK